MSWIKNEWNSCITFYRNCIHRKALLVGLLFFVIGAFIWVLLSINTDVLMAAYNWLLSIFESKGIDQSSIKALDLFKNNTIACIYCILQGFIPFFFLGIISLVLNSASIGIIGALYSYQNMSMAVLVAGLIPHGIFELPAIFISLALSFTTCLYMSKKIVGKMNEFDIKEHTLNCVRVFVFIVLPLLVLAACIESYVTPVIMGLFM